MWGLALGWGGGGDYAGAVEMCVRADAENLVLYAGVVGDNGVLLVRATP